MNRKIALFAPAIYNQRGRGCAELSLANIPDGCCKGGKLAAPLRNNQAETLTSRNRAVAKPRPTHFTKCHGKAPQIVSSLEVDRQIEKIIFASCYSSMYG